MVCAAGMDEAFYTPVLETLTEKTTMNPRITVLKLTAVAVSLAILSGCASTKALEEVRLTAEAAKAEAAEARALANQAQGTGTRPRASRTRPCVPRTRRSRTRPRPNGFRSRTAKR
jgi:hypothetical protein